MALKILVADDNVDSTTFMEYMLRANGHEVIAVNSGSDAISVAESFCPDVAVLDIAMPRKSGLEVCEHLRGRPCGKRTRFVAITGGGASRVMTKAAGFQWHFDKPVRFDELLAVLNDLRPASVV